MHRWRGVEIAVASAIALVWALAELARRRPDLGWLAPLRTAFARLPEQQRARMRRQSDRREGVKFILLAIAIPLIVGTLKLMFSSFSAMELAVVLGVSLLFFALGIAAIAKSRRG
jgi:hypothetical protein